MSILHDVSRHKSISGLRLKRKLGEKIMIEHASGDKITLQVITFSSGGQVTLAFQGERDAFKISRDEVLNGRVE